MTLILAATPLGNPADASTRLKSAIENASIIAAEDSRRFHRLCADIEVTFTARVLSFFEGNEEDRTRELLAELKSGAEVLVVSDAGMPTISDPGFRLMRDAIAEGIEVSVIPGPSAVTMAVHYLDYQLIVSHLRDFLHEPQAHDLLHLKNCALKSEQWFSLKHHTVL
jgi:16S rRNA (cytidine1402-2'-O)-methyltransferase